MLGAHLGDVIDAINDRREARRFTGADAGGFQYRRHGVIIAAMETTAPDFTAAQQRMLDRIEEAPTEAATFQLLQLAASYWKSGQTAEFAECFRRAYRRGRCRKISSLLTSRDDMEELARITQALIDHGCRYSDVISEHAIAEALLGRVDAVRSLVDYGRFFRQGRCIPPSGSSLEGFNRAVADEIKPKLAFYDEEDASAIRKSWRNDTALQAKTPALAALKALLAREVETYLANLPDDPDHPFIASRPREYDLDGWANASPADGYLLPHIHSRTWATGVYYVTQPEVSRDTHGQRGWLRVGSPPELDGKEPSETGWETRLIEPVAGSFILMPAYFTHATEPMGVEQERISIAFEVQPAEFRDQRPRRSKKRPSQD